MRSRYSTYSQANITYIEKTMRGPAVADFNPIEAQLWASQVKWLRLKVISVPSVTEGDDVGFVEFIAYFMEKGQRRSLHERSEFHRLEGRWYYYKSQT